jgi:hypothetical protein
MIMLHDVSRFQRLPKIRDDLQLLAGAKPATLKDFVNNHLEQWKEFRNAGDK